MGIPTVCGLPKTMNKTEREILREVEFSCVYALGPAKGRPMKIAWCIDPYQRLLPIQSGYWQDLICHHIAWTAGPPLARRLVEELHRLFDISGRRLKGDWFDVPVEMMRPSFEVACNNLRLETFSHGEMIEKVKAIREKRIQSTMRATGALTIQTA